jgi:hypothetical protein
MLIAVASLTLGAVAAKFFWASPPPLKAAAAPFAARSATSSTKPPRPAPAVTAGPTRSSRPSAGGTSASSSASASGAPTKTGDAGASVPAVADADLPLTLPAYDDVADAADPLGAAYVDELYGYAMRFPSEWPVRTFAGDPWVLDCGDAKTALISVGFLSRAATPAAAAPAADDVTPDWLARRTTSQPGAVLHAQGTATIQGRKALWSRATGPLALRAGPATATHPRMMQQTYVIPLTDGRVMEVRIAATPEQYERFAGVMKRSVATLRLTSRAPSRTR